VPIGTWTGIGAVATRVCTASTGAADGAAGGGAAAGAGGATGVDGAAGVAGAGTDGAVGAGASVASGPSGASSEAGGASEADSSPAPPSPGGFCFRAYATVRPREILDTWGVRFALAMISWCHASTPWRK
jgi:hypothetical protein